VRNYKNIYVERFSVRTDRREVVHQALNRFALRAEDPYEF
jgi:hypothetical protein